MQFLTLDFHSLLKDVIWTTEKSYNVCNNCRLDNSIVINANFLVFQSYYDYVREFLAFRKIHHICIVL